MARERFGQEGRGYGYGAGFGAYDDFGTQGGYGGSGYAGYGASGYGAGGQPEYFGRGRAGEGERGFGFEAETPFGTFEAGVARRPGERGARGAGSEIHTWRGGMLGWLGAGIRAAAGWIGDRMQSAGTRLGGQLSGGSADLGERVRGRGAQVGGALEDTGDQAMRRGMRLDVSTRGAERRGRAPRAYRRPDERILDDVCERIGRSPADGDEVEVEVREGVVTLKGRVPTRLDRRMIEDVADGVFGVDEVHNQIRVARAVQPTGTQASEDVGAPGRAFGETERRSGNGHASEQATAPGQA